MMAGLSKNRILRALIYTSAALTLCSCASLNPFSRKAAPRNPPAVLVEFQPTLKVRSLWSSAIGSAGAAFFKPALVNDQLFVAAADGTVARIDGRNGQQIWRINAGFKLTAGVGSDGIAVAVTGGKNQLAVFDNAGKLRWSAQLPSEALSAPAVGDGLVVVRSVDNQILAFDAESGNKRWNVQRPVPTLTLRSSSGILIEKRSVFVAMPGGKLLALSASNGAVLWESTVADPHGATELERIVDTTGAPLVTASDICAVAYQGRLACMEISNGNLRWAKPLSADVGLAADEQLVFAVDERGTVSAFSRDNGASIWSNKQLANRNLSTPAVLGRALLVGDGTGYVHFLSREDGALIARVATDGSAIKAAPLVQGKQAFVQTKSGSVVALVIE